MDKTDGIYPRPIVCVLLYIVLRHLKIETVSDTICTQTIITVCHWTFARSNSLFVRGMV